MTAQERIQAKVTSTHYGVKSMPFEVKDLDKGSRKVKIGLASFDTLDSDMDVIRPGAFAKSIAEHGPDSSGNRKIAHLRHHDWEHQIGRFTELTETSTHLEGVSQLGRSTAGNDAFLDYQDGIIKEHSIGFNYIADKMSFVEDSTFNEDGHFEITEVKLWEGSAVTFGANSLTPVFDVAKGDVESYEKVFKKLQEMSEAFANALKNGKGTDERLEAIEMKFKQIRQLQDSLIESKPSVKDTLKNKPTGEENQEHSESFKFYY